MASSPAVGRFSRTCDYAGVDAPPSSIWARLRGGVKGEGAAAAGDDGCSLQGRSVLGHGLDILG